MIIFSDGDYRMSMFFNVIFYLILFFTLNNQNVFSDEILFKLGSMTGGTDKSMQGSSLLGFRLNATDESKSLTSIFYGVQIDYVSPTVYQDEIKKQVLFFLLLHL
jgi:hypothetical protein